MAPRPTDRTDADATWSRADRGPAPTGRLETLEALVAVLAGSLALSLVTGDWIAGAGILVLASVWRLLRTDEGPPVLAMAVTFQWIQVTAGLYYYGLTGRALPAIVHSDYRPMVLIGLGCVVALALGLAFGSRVGFRIWGVIRRPERAFLWPGLLAMHVGCLFLTGTVQELAWRLPGLTQGVLALTYVRYAILFIMFWRLTHPRVRFGWMALLLAQEVALGFTGYFAGFREPLMMAAVALLSVFDRRKWRHWVVLGALIAIMALSGLIWMSIRVDYRSDFENQLYAESRQERLERVAALTSTWVRQDFVDLADDLDAFVDRLWAIYYPALAVERVPALLPHEDGDILWRAVMHIVTPRLLAPDKATLTSDSEMVRRYSGVWVAGDESRTSIAFGYAGESYVDFGVPLMFLPVLVYGLLMGFAYRAWLRVIVHRELAVGFAAAAFWLSLYLFERSWIKTLGLSATVMVYLGTAVVLLDRFLAAPMVGLDAPRRRASRGPKG
jgi:hypothetical protein